MTKKFDLMKKMLNGSTTMPQTTQMRGPNASNVHYHDGVPCTHDHGHGQAGHVHDENCNHGHDHAEHVHDENCKHDH